MKPNDRKLVSSYHSISFVYIFRSIDHYWYLPYICERDKNMVVCTLLANYLCSFSSMIKERPKVEEMRIKYLSYLSYFTFVQFQAKRENHITSCRLTHLNN